MRFPKGVTELLSRRGAGGVRRHPVLVRLLLALPRPARDGTGHHFLLSTTWPFACVVAATVASYCASCASVNVPFARYRRRASSRRVSFASGGALGDAVPSL